MAVSTVAKNAGILTFSGVCAKSVEFIFRAYYSKLLGSEGMGLLSLVFGVHGIMLTLASAGLGTATSTLVSAQYAAHNEASVPKTMRTVIGMTVVMSAAVIGAVLLFSDRISASFLGDARTRVGICALAPSTLFMSISYCIKGYFYASRKVIRPASSEFLEQFVKVLAMRGFLKLFLPLGVEYGCAGVFLGLSVGEAASCTYLILMFVPEYRRLSGRGKPATQTGTLAAVLKISLPTLTGALISSFLRMYEDVKIISGLTAANMPAAEALSQYGLLKGMIMPLLTFPLTLIGSFITLLVPEISRTFEVCNKVRFRSLASRALRLAFAAGVAVMLVFVIFSRQVSAAVYGKPEIADAVRRLALLCPLMFLDSVSCGILNGMKRQFRMFLYSMCDSALRLFVIIFFVPRYGWAALIFMIAASNIFTCALSFGTVRLSEAYTDRGAGRACRERKGAFRGIL